MGQRCIDYSEEVLKYMKHSETPTADQFLIANRCRIKWKLFYSEVRVFPSPSHPL